MRDADVGFIAIPPKDDCTLVGVGEKDVCDSGWATTIVVAGINTDCVGVAAAICFVGETVIA